MDSTTEPRMESLVREGPCGGCDGDLKDMKKNTIINMNGFPHIGKIVVHHSEIVDSVEIFYLVDDKYKSIGRWGGSGGSPSEFILRGDEYFTSIRGYVAEWEGQTVVGQLSFVTNLKSHGPFGLEETMAFQLPAVIGKIVGFHGNAGNFLNAFGTYVKL